MSSTVFTILGITSPIEKYNRKKSDGSTYASPFGKVFILGIGTLFSIANLPSEYRLNSFTDDGTGIGK